MATSADIGANFSDYQGNAALGGAGLGVFDIDTRPLSQLAQYTFFYKKNLWEQKQKETDAKVAELADLSNISLNDLRGKDKEQATKEFAELQNYASEYARKDPKTPQERMQNELEWQTKYGAFKNNYGSGKTRAVTYYKLRNEILSKITEAKTQDEAIRQLDKQFEDTSIDTPISAVPNFKIEKFDIPEPTSQKFNSVAILGNENLDIQGSVYNPKLNAGVADATILGIGKAYPKQGTPEYDNLSENEKNQANIQSTITSSGKGWVDATEPLNAALKRYIKDGKFDAEGFETDNASNTTLMNAYNALKNYDAYNRNKYNEALNGNFNDRGLSIPLAPNVNPNDFKVGFVDFANGVNPNQLVQSGMFAKYTGDVFAKKITETDNAIQRATLAATIADNNADRFLKSKELKLNEDKWKATQTGSTTQVNGAMERAKRIYADMLKLTDKNGVISPDKIRQLNVEQLKYLGIEAPETIETIDGTTTKIKGGFKPLTFEPETQYAIQLINGEIRVLKPLKGKNVEKTVTGGYRGLFDPTKSTNIYNVGTNILNEELKNAGTKELNSYFGVDVTGTPIMTTEGGTQTQSGSTKSKGGMSDEEYKNFLKKNGLQ